MRLLILIAIMLFALPMAVSTSFAQSNRALQQLSLLNRINPLQNPDLERDSKIIDRKIIDRKNKVVGQVDDIILKQNGTIANIKTNFNRLRLKQDVYLNYRNLRVRTVSNAYALSMDADEITQLYPQLLSEIAPASGENADTFSLKKLVGATVKSENGKTLGTAENILFGSNGGIARAINLELSHGINRGEKIAVPFQAVEFSMRGNKVQGVISEDVTQAILTLADD